MKQGISLLVSDALARLQNEGALSGAVGVSVQVERTKDPRHGDFACNVAMLLAKAARKPPREVAAMVVGALGGSDLVARTEIAGPGFINFYLDPAAVRRVVPDILAAGPRYGCSTLGAGMRIQVEYVSANPTGPLHIGHGRGAAYGAVVANLLDATGHAVQREYYVNDAGRQMHILALSVWLRYLELGGARFSFPANGYKGGYIRDIAAALREARGALFDRPLDAAFSLEAPEDAEAHIDGLIDHARASLGDGPYRELHAYGLNGILDQIRDDLEVFGVTFDHWYSEQSLADSGAIDRAIARLEATDYLYRRDGATWFRSTAFGDEKDRVVVRENGQKTYFASDIAYHLEKFDRGHEHVIDVWGADHHGYIPRVRAVLSALGLDPQRLEVLLVQFATLYRGGERVQMSTRSGEFVTLQELREEVGRDAARFFYVMRRSEQHLDFDLDLAKSRSNENPVYYIQYAHARVCSVFRQMAEQELAWDEHRGVAALDRLDAAEEQALFTRLSRYPETVEGAALAREPHQVANYLRELATEFHQYYNTHKFLVDDVELRDARIALIAAVRQVIRNGLALLGVSAPEAM